MTIIIIIKCDTCDKELAGKEGFHVDHISGGMKTNYNFCSDKCMCDYFSPEEKGARNAADFQEKEKAILKDRYYDKAAT